jgi:hypothetical protein
MSVVPLPLLSCEERFRFSGFDIGPDKGEALNRAGSYIVRIQGAQIQQARQSGFVAAGDYARIAQMGRRDPLRPTPNSFALSLLPTTRSMITLRSWTGPS